MFVCSRRENGSGVCLDLQVIDNIPGAKVEEDMETHHVLAGNLYKPRRRVSFFLQGAPRFLKVVEIVLESTQDVSGSLKSLLRSLKKIRTGEQVSLGNEMCLSAWGWGWCPLCSVSVPLQSSLHAAGGAGAPGPGGVSEEHEEPHGDLQIHPIQTPQEGTQPEKGETHQSPKQALTKVQRKHIVLLSAPDASFLGTAFRLFQDLVGPRVLGLSC